MEPAAIVPSQFSIANVGFVPRLLSGRRMPADTFQIELNQDKRPGLFVIAAGLATTSICLAVLHFLNQADIQVMGFYAYGILPAGAIIVGLVSGSGYGFASRLKGAKIGRGLLLMVLVLQVVAYFGAKYLDYLDHIEVMRRVPGREPAGSFMEYFDAVTRELRFVRRGRLGPAFGVWGYALRAMELAGFACGGAIAPALLRAVPYCNKCQFYMKTREFGRLPAGVKPRKIKPKDTAGQIVYQQELKEAMDAGLHLLDDIQQTIESQEPARFREIISAYAGRKKEIARLSHRFILSLVRCPRCNSGKVLVTLVTGHAEAIRKEQAMEWEVDQAFLLGLAAK